MTAPAEQVDQSARFRLIPTRGRACSWFVFGSDAARGDAERSFAATGIPVRVCVFPPDGLCKALYTVGKYVDPKAKKPQAVQA